MPNIPRKPVGRVNLQDIAAYAGVSIGSVSSVLNNRQLERRIPQDTAQKIREAAAKLGYLPNISARRLRSSPGVKNSILLALITSFEAPIPLINHFISALHQEAESEEILHRGYSFSLMIEMFAAGRLREMPGLMTGDHFNAAIILNTVPEDDQFLTRSHLPYPVVLVNRSIPGYASVVENQGSGARAADLLVRGKNSRLAVLHGVPLTQTTQNRVDTFMKRSSELLGRPAKEIRADKLSEAGGYKAMKSFFSAQKKCDGLYAVSDALALGAYRAIKERGLRIPQDLSVVGVGDYEIAPFLDPPLSSIGVSHKELADQASRLLFRQLLGEATTERVYTSISEALRESTGSR